MSHAGLGGSVDLSAYVPYTGATADLDLGNNSISANQGIFNDGAGRSVDLLNATQGIKLEDTVSGISLTFLDSSLGEVFNGNLGAGLSIIFGSSVLGQYINNNFKAENGGGSFAGYFEDGSNYVTLANGTNALEVTGYATFSGYVQTGGVLVNENSPMNNANYFDCNGQGGFYGNSGSMVAEFGNASHAAYFYDGLTTTYICNSTYGLQTSGAIQAGGVVEASGFYATGIAGYSGPLNDSTSTQIADVVGGIITAVYY